MMGLLQSLPMPMRIFHSYMYIHPIVIVYTALQSLLPEQADVLTAPAFKDVLQHIYDHFFSLFSVFPAYIKSFNIEFIAVCWPSKDNRDACHAGYQQ